MYLTSNCGSAGGGSNQISPILLARQARRRARAARRGPTAFRPRSRRRSWPRSLVCRAGSLPTFCAPSAVVTSTSSPSTTMITSSSPITETRGPSLSTSTLRQSTSSTPARDALPCCVPRERGVQRLPVADVRPGHVGGNHRRARGVLHHRIVDRIRCSIAAKALGIGMEPAAVCSCPLATASRTAAAISGRCASSSARKVPARNAKMPPFQA